MTGVQKVFQNMKKQGVDLAVLADPANVKYVSGFDVPFWPAWMGDVSNGLPLAAAVLDAEAEKVRLVASDFYQSKLIRAGIGDPEIYRSFTHLEKNDPDYNFHTALKKTLQAMGGGRQKPVVGLEPNFAAWSVIQAVKKAFPEGALENVSQLLADSRYIKTPEDLSGLKEAARAADAAQMRLCEIAWKEGSYTELDIWFEVQKAASAKAGSLVPFVGELVTGPSAGLSDYPLGPTSRKVEKGDIAIMDISPRVNGYWGDCSNSVVFWDRPDDEQKRYFDVVKDVFEAGLKAIVPGARFREVNRIMERQYEKHGLKICSYQGHQIGCSVNEKPRFTYTDDSFIEKDMVLCIEPQIYSGKKGKTGVRLERMLHVTENGAVSLNQFPWGIQ